MPDTSVRDMSTRQRLHHSISARTFRSTVIGCVFLGLIALVLSLLFYTISAGRQLIDSAYRLAYQARVSVTHGADGAGLTDRVMQKYHDLNAVERALTGSEAYRSLFAEEKQSEDYDVLVHILQGFMESGNVFDVYLAMYDEQTEALVYVVDPDDSLHFDPGEWERAEPGEMEKFLNWDGESQLYDISKTEDYGWLCTTGLPIQDQYGGIHGFVLVDLAVDNLLADLRDFALRLSLAMILVTALIAWILTRRMKKAIVEPINAIAAAAAKYTGDHLVGGELKDHFSKLNIRTGDELEELGLTMADMERDMANYVKELTSVTAEKERIGTELSLATKIQRAMLPSVFPAFPERPEFDIYATTASAREVGGDFYDFFFVDDDHLCIVVADVSGKGVPAALFMMIAKAIIQSIATLSRSAAEILNKTNDAICAKNAENMFVTVWLGILEISTGKLRAANAGHELPVVRHPGEDFALYRDRHGLVVGGMEGMRYPEYEIQMEPGSSLFLYTDGVPEATDRKDDAFGTDRMLEALNRDPDAAPIQVLANVRQAVDDFVQDAEQFDDLTMLCLKYVGAAVPAPAEEPEPEAGPAAELPPEDEGWQELKLPALAENLERVQEFVGEAAGEDCPMKARMQLDLAVEEIFINIASYAYAPGVGDALVRVRAAQEPPALTVVFCDSGVPYDPLAKEDPDVTAMAEERKIGGLGIFLTKQIMDELRYEYRDGQNILTMKKNL